MEYFPAEIVKQECPFHVIVILLIKNSPFVKEKTDVACSFLFYHDLGKGSKGKADVKLLVSSIVVVCTEIAVTCADGEVAVHYRPDICLS